MISFFYASNSNNMNKNILSPYIRIFLLLIFFSTIVSIETTMAQVWLNLRTLETDTNLRKAHDDGSVQAGDVLQWQGAVGDYSRSLIGGSSPVNITKEVIIDGSGSTFTNTSGTVQALWLNYGTFGGEPNKTFTVRNITFCGYNGNNGGTIGSSAGANTEFVLSNVNVHGSSNSNYAVQLEGSATITNCNFSNNGSVTGGLYIKNGGTSTAQTVMISNSIFDCNGDPGNGGGIAIVDGSNHPNSTFTITGGSASNNQGQSAGGIYFSCGGGSSLNISGMTIHNNTIDGVNSGSGAGIYANSASGSSNLNISNCSFEQNSAGGGSGAINAAGNVTATINSTQFRENTGGNMVVSGASVNSSIFSSNSTEYNTVGTNIITSLGIGMTSTYNYAGAVQNTCIGGCSGPVGGSSTGTQIVIPGGTLDAGETLISTGAGLIYYRTEDGATGSFATTSPIPNELGGKHVVFWQAVSSGTSPVFGGLVAASALPVELTHFEAEQKEKTVLLTWQTISEANNKGFYIEKSKDSKNWEVIGFLEGAINSTNKVSYTHSDKNPYIGINYYRLQQVDLDGDVEYSEWVSVTIKDATAQLYPNPVQDHFTLNLGQQQTVKTIQLFDFSGHLIRNMTFSSAQQDEILVSATDLHSGIYFVKIIYTNELIETLKFVKKS